MLGGDFIRAGIWLKKNPAPQFSGDRPGEWGENISICHNGRGMKWNGGGKSAVWIFGSPHGDERNHETPKPVDLMMALVSDFTDPDDLVWDPYCGSGTTGVACMRLGRRFLGHEMQPHYAEIAARRLQAEDRGLTLADADRGQLSIMDAMEGES
jgi:site-specific DNA-methyltransferase (adenine-specific)